MVLAQTVRRYCGRRRVTALGTRPGVFRAAARGSLRADWRKLLRSHGDATGFSEAAELAAEQNSHKEEARLFGKGHARPARSATRGMKR